MTSTDIGPRTDADSVESEVTPSDFESTAPTQTEEQIKTVALVEERAREASLDQRPYVGRGMLSLAFYNGEQYGYYKSATHELVDSRDLTNGERVYGVHNKLRPVASHLTARAMSSEVAAVFRPKTGRPDDIAGTRQMRAIWAHVQKANDWESLHTRLHENTIIVGTPYVQTTYDTSLWVEIPELVPGTDPANPEIANVHDAKLGDISLDFVSFSELLIDPKARTLKEADWVIFEKRRSLSYIRSKWPKTGRWVEGDPTPNIAETLRDGATLSYPNRTGKSASKTAIVRTVWELPTGVGLSNDEAEEQGLYPKGRYIVVAGGRELESEDYLYPEMAKQRIFPFCPFPYRNGIETPYGDNALYPVVDPQRDYNRAWNKIGEHAKRGDGKILADRGCELDPKAFRAEARDEVIYYTKQDPRFTMIEHDKPDFIELPPLDAVISESLQISDSDIKAISSVNDPSLGTNKGDLSGTAINALQDGDQSEGILYKDNDRRGVSEVARNVGILAKQFYIENEARMVYVQDTAPINQPAPVFPSQTPQSPQGAPGQPMAGQPGPQAGPVPDPHDAADAPTMQAMIFNKIGRGRWTVETTAEASMSPSAKRQMLMQLMTGGAFTPQQMPATMVLLREFGLLSSDETMDDLKNALQLMMQSITPPQQPPPPDPLAMLQIEQHLKSMSERMKIQEQAQADIQKMQAEAALPIKPTVSLAAKADAAGTIAIEEEVGLDVHGAATHAATVSAIDPNVAHHYSAGPTPSVQSQQAQQQAGLDAAAADRAAANQSGQIDQQHANTMEQTGVQHQNVLEQGDAAASNQAELQSQAADQAAQSGNDE